MQESNKIRRDKEVAENRQSYRGGMIDATSAVVPLRDPSLIFAIAFILESATRFALIHAPIFLR